jgi:hypothetical protein
MISLINNCNPWESQRIKKVYRKRDFDFKYNYIDFIVEYISVKTLLIKGNYIFCLNSVLYLISNSLIILFNQSICFSALNASVGTVFCFIQKNSSEQRIEKFTIHFFVIMIFSSIKTLIPVGLSLIIIRINLYVFS